MSDNDDDNDNLQNELQKMHQEIEATEYRKDGMKQRRRKQYRHEITERIKRRRELEQQDAKEAPESLKEKRTLRGSKAAITDEIVNKSMILQQQASDEEKSDVEEDDDTETDNEEEEASDQDEDVELDQDEEDATAQFTKKRFKKSASSRRKKLYRMKNFTSLRLAEQHGEAMAAHARGMSSVAIEKLRSIAKQVPSAPQVYSSLGIVYTDMLQERQRKYIEHSQGEKFPYYDLENNNNEDTAVDSDLGHELAEQITIAKKAFGSFHAAAILNSKDYMHWVRAADTAIEIADLHEKLIKLPSNPDRIRLYHRSERMRWLAEAKNDYNTADKLGPPGIDVPAKLATVFIDVGCLAEALTLLTDLKSRSAFRSSYKAWQLYSDLMLRIGYECKKWNDGDRTNDNYMFRRWLRKYSSTFDWKERRLQSLSKALEAAAGSKSCSAYIAWLYNRGNDMVKDVKAASSNNNISSDAINNATTADEESDVQLVNEKNRVELEDFDRTTQDMGIDSSSVFASERAKEREELIAKQQQKFDIEEETRDESLLTHQLSTSSESFNVSASCDTVFFLASLLLRHLLDMKLYKGGQLIGESVSLYLKQRASMFRQDRKDQDRLFDQHNSMTGGDSMDIHNEERAELSDDDMLDDDEIGDKIEMLRKGLLPPEIQTMYALSLVGLGGYDFVARKCLETIQNIQQESVTWLQDEKHSGEIVFDRSWREFKRYATDPIGRTAAFSLAANLIRSCNKEKVWAERVIDMYEDHVELLDSTGFLREVMKPNAFQTSAMNTNQTMAAQVVVEAAKLRMITLYNQSKLDANKSDDDKLASLVFAAIDRLLNLLGVFWRVQSDGSISMVCIDILQSLSQGFIMIKSLKCDDSTELWKKTIKRLCRPVGLFCSRVRLNFLQDNADADLFSSQSFPFPSSWQTTEHKLLSLRAHNLCISSCVSLFSGWEESEFSVRLLRHRDSPSFYGLSSRDGLISGYLDEDMQDELLRQWKLLRDVLPEISSYNMEAQFDELRKSAWYMDKKAQYESAVATIPMHLFAEDRGLDLLVQFSGSCVNIATTTDQQAQRTTLCMNSLSILLPMLQFCLNQKLWDSTLGTSSSMNKSGISSNSDDVRTALNNSRLNQGSHFLQAESRMSYYLGARKKIDKALDESGLLKTDTGLCSWFFGEDSNNPLANLVPIPLNKLNSMWKSVGENKSADPDSDEVALVDSTLAAGSLDAAMKTLRQCRSQRSVEKAAVYVAACLLDVVGSAHCYNRFLCIEQAASYASLGSNADKPEELFQHPLPKPTKCTAVEALVIHGRGQCFQALNHFAEAAYLCSAVARICSIKRKSSNKQDWNTQWSVVAILAYNLSVIIRLSAFNHENGETPDFVWNAEVVEELLCARTEGMTIQSSLQKPNHVNAVEV